MDNPEKSCLFINRSTPHGSSKAREALDMAFTLAAFEHNVSMVFMDDGITQLLRDQDTTDSGMKNFSLTFRAWEDYGVEHLYLEKSSLESRGLTASDLLLPIEIIDTESLAQLIDSHEFIFNY